MSQENVEVVRRFLLRCNERDLDAAASDLATEAELDTSASEAPDSGVYRGPEQWRKSLTGRTEELADARFDVPEVIDVPRRVTGATSYDTRNQALKAVGLEG